MKSPRHIAIAIALVGLMVSAPAPRASGDDALALAKSGSEAFVKAFNAHDAKAIGLLCDESADFAFLQGSSFETLQFGEVSGRGEIVSVVETFFRLFPDAKISHTPRRARFLTPDVLISDVDYEITGLAADSGPIRGQFVLVRVKTGGSWKIAAERNVSRVMHRAR